MWNTENKISGYTENETVKTLDELLIELSKDGLITEEEKKEIEETGKVTIGTRTIVFEKRVDTLAYYDEQTPDSSFLGNNNIKRNEIESVTIGTTLGTHSVNDENCWDVSRRENGEYLAWYEDKDSDGFYEVTIAGDGEVVANANSSYLFYKIGANGDDTNVLYGLENLNTEAVTTMDHMFYGMTNLQSLNLTNFDTSNVLDMKDMFGHCENLKSIKMKIFDTSNVKNMFHMFIDCTKLEELDVSNFNTSNVTNMNWMFSGCSRANEIRCISL